MEEHAHRPYRIAAERQRDGNGAVRTCAERANRRTLRIDYLKDRTAQRRVCTFLQLGDLQTGIRYGGIAIVRIVAVCGHPNGDCEVGIAHIVLELTVFSDLRTGGIKDSVFIHIGDKGKLHTAGFPATDETGYRILNLPAYPSPVPEVVIAVMSLLSISTMRVPSGTEAGSVKETLIV